MDHLTARYQYQEGVPMERPFASALTDGHADQPSVGTIPLAGRWLLLARLLWCTMSALSLAFFVVSMLVNRFDLVFTALLVAGTSVWFAVSGVLFWRKSRDRVIL